MVKTHSVDWGRLSLDIRRQPALILLDKPYDPSFDILNATPEMRTTVTNLWVEAAYQYILTKEYEVQRVVVGVNADIRAILKDLDDLARMYMCGGKNPILLDVKDLPSYAMSGVNTQHDNDKNPEQSPEVRKAFLKHLAQQYKDKNDDK